MPIFHSQLAGWVHPADLFAGLFGSAENAFWLDRQSHPTERFSVIGGTTQVLSGSDIEALRTEIGNQEKIELPYSFRPGLVGYISYEGEYRFLKVDRALVLDHDSGVINFIGEFESKTEFDYWHNAALLRIGVSGGEQAMYKLRNPALKATNFSVRHSDDQYLELIRGAQNFIASGDIYQACLTNEISLDVRGDGLHTFLRLRESNPAPYAAYLRVGDTEIICSSPEQFLKLDASGCISSKPIKGTRPRGATAAEDQEQARALSEDPKERAENLMIVDLMRNDFARVAKADSVAVPKLFDLESYATVHQLVSTITAELESERDIFDVIAAAFPGGSMTGAPKIRAMQIISELEAGERGIYSGIIGHINSSGQAEFGMVIRTIVRRGDSARIGIGGGITSDSVPELELRETKIKAAALLRVLEADDALANW